VQGTVSLAEFREALKLSDSLDEQKIDEVRGLGSA
jgi:hypothetical protein